jgi:FtsZ-interacting cell division protein ZipA
MVTIVQLRWILLLAGVIFLLALAAWELRRAQRARRVAAAEATEAAEAARGALAADDRAHEQRAAGRFERRREPTLNFNPDLDTYQAPPIAPHGAGSEHAVDPSVDPEPEAEVALASSAPIEARPPLRVDWPDERERRIIAVRIVAAPGERLAGRAVRQALGACGFVHGPYRIYHQPAADGRALLSCANLMKPGDFDPLTLDFQRLTGLSVFALLPGPLPPLTALEHLLATADELAQRLRAELADERGAPLDAARVAALRTTVEEWMAPKDPSAPDRSGPRDRPGAQSARGA